MEKLADVIVRLQGLWISVFHLDNLATTTIEISIMLLLMMHTETNSDSEANIAGSWWFLGRR